MIRDGSGENENERQVTVTEIQSEINKQPISIDIIIGQE